MHKVSDLLAGSRLGIVHPDRRGPTARSGDLGVSRGPAKAVGAGGLPGSSRSAELAPDRGERRPPRRSFPAFVKVPGGELGRVIELNSTAARVRLGDTPDNAKRDAFMRSHYPTWTPPEWAERWFPLRFLSPA